MRAELPLPVRLSVLGDIALFDETGTETPLAPQRLHIMAALAAGAGAVVPRSSLLSDLWGHDSDTTRQRLKAQITQIRSALSDGLNIEFRLDGYRLSGSLDQLDSTRFESLVTTGRALEPAAAADHYEAALALWRSPVPFGGVDSLLIDEARRSLEALRTATVTALARCEVELRRPRAALGAIMGVFDDDPTRGDVAVLTATLLALAGRQTEGLRLIERHRSALIDVGLEPGADVAELEGRILRHDLGASGAPVAVPRPEPKQPPGALGAGGSQRLARAAIERQVTDQLRAGPVALWGEAGVGKTVVAGAVADGARAAGRPVVKVTARPDPTRPMEAMAELVEALAELRPEHSARLLTRAITAAAVRRLSGRVGPDDPLISRDELITELGAFIATLAGPGDDCLLVLEDAHWLDNSSAEIVSQLVEAAQAGLLLTTRRPLPQIFGQRWPEAASIELPPLTRDEVRQLLQEALPVRASDDLARALHERTGGNSLFLRLELDLLAEGRLGRDLQPTVRHAVHERTAGFSRATRDVLGTAALLGQTFPLAPLAAIHPHLLASLQDAIDEHLVRVDAETDTGEFVHGLVVDAFVELLAAPTRTTRHDQLYVELARLSASPVALAKQAVGAVELDPARAVVQCLRAGQQEAEVFEWGAAIDWSTLGLQTMERFHLGQARTEAELRLLAGRGLRRLNRPGSDVALGLAADRALAVDDQELFVRAVTELCLHGPTTQAGSVDNAVGRHLDQALAAPVDRLVRAELMAAAATLLAVTDEAGRGRSLYRTALDDAEAAAQPAVLRTVLMNAHLGLSHPNDLDVRRRAASGILAFDDHEAQWEGRFLRFGLALIDADRPGLDQAMDDLRRLTSAVRQRDHQRSLRQVESVYAFVNGDLATATTLADEAFQAALETFSVSWAVSIYFAQLLPVRETEGRAGQLQSEIGALLQSSPEFMTWHAAAASIAYFAGDEAAMAAELDHVARHQFQLVEDLTWTAVATVLCRPVWWRAERAMADALYELLAPHTGRMSWNGLSTHGPVDSGLALLAATLGRSHAAEGHLERSRSMVGHLRAPHLWWPELDRLGQQRHPDIAPHLH